MTAIFAIALLAACAAPKYTVDDGRKVDETLLGHIRSYGQGEQALRPAIARSAALHDSQCDTQWELPFSVASSDDWSEDDRVAWVRALGVDERLTVVAVAPDSPVQRGDKIQGIDGYSKDNAEKMLLELADRRDAGRAFKLKLASNNEVNVQPFKVCRGYTRLAPPNSPQTQDYHWLLSVHPLQITQVPLSEDEALWMVLWTQGLSEEGGARMKTYHYGSKIVGTLYNIFTIATGIKGAAVAADAAMSVAQTAATSAATQLIKDQLIDQVTAASMQPDESVPVGANKLTQQQVKSAMRAATANRRALKGVAWVASTVFEQADAWAYNHLEQLGADPLAGLRLHQKLLEQGLASNAMVLDPERMTALDKIAQGKGRGEDVVAILQGIKPQELIETLAEMPVASASNGFAYEDPVDQPGSAQPFARGLIDGMLSMPVASRD